jgi:hypothetical protein
MVWVLAIKVMDEREFEVKEVSGCSEVRGIWQRLFICNTCPAEDPVILAHFVRRFGVYLQQKNTINMAPQSCACVVTDWKGKYISVLRQWPLGMKELSFSLVYLRRLLSGPVFVWSQT